MDLFLHIGFLVLGLAMLYYGAEWLVSGSASLALRMGVSSLVVGLTVVAFGTSAPELSVGIQLNTAGSPDAAVGNVVGSNICNILLILGLSAMFRPMVIKAQIIKREMPILVLVTLIFIAMIWDGKLVLWEGVVLTIGIVLYVWLSFRLARKERDPSVIAEFEDLEDDESTKKAGYPRLTMLIIVGLIILVIGSDLFQKGGIFLANAFGVSEAVIGLTLLAFGTSLPELATSVVASLKNEGDIIAGNALGSCIFNIFCVLGITVLVKPMIISDIQPIDLWFMIGSAVVVLPLMYTRMRLARTEGAILLAAYVVYIFLAATR